MILASGCFDGLHAGHVAYLEAAHALCEHEEVLVVAVAPDAYIVKTKHRSACWTQAERLQTVAALTVVDATIAQSSTSVAQTIRDFRPRIFVKGSDWQDRLPEAILVACTQTGTAIAFVETPGRHTSEAQTG